MRKIIDGKMYNTDTATFVESYNNGYFTNDFNYFEESLYRKKNGEFFLHGEGGALSKYSSRSREGDSIGYGERIIPLTLNEAKKWCENYAKAETYEKLFGEISEDDTRTTINISMSTSEAELIRRNAREANMTIGAYIVSKCTE